MPSVLIARERKRARPLMDALAKLGIDSKAIAVTRTEFVFKEDVAVRFHEFAWLAFTSVNGVLGLEAWLKQTSQRLPDGMRIAAVGKTTAASARKTFHTPELVSKTATGIGLARELIQLMDSSQQRLLWACSMKPRPEFAQELLSANINVTSLPVYETIAEPPAKLCAKLADAGKFDAIVFAAPSGVESFAQASTERNLPCVVMGNTSASAAKDAGFKHVFITPEPDPSALAKTIHDAIEKNNS